MPIRTLAAFVAAFGLSLVALPALADESGCRKERDIRSKRSDTATTVEFKNKSDGKMRVYWIKYEGKREHYADVKPGKTYTQDTYMTHPWVVTDMDGQCVMLFRPLPGATVATIRTVD